MIDEPVGLRERKNARTREAITRAACELILERGFEGATIAQIAERADVAPRTVHTWFSSKEDIVLGGLVQPLDRLAAALAGSDGDVLERIVRWMQAEGEPHVDDLSLLRQRAVASDPHLRGLAMAMLADSEKAIALAVAQDAGVAADGVAAHTYAGAVITLLTTLGDRVAERRVRTDPADLEAALALLRGALDALRGHAASA
jgi:AcrR family transcriptional regulator